MGDESDRLREYIEMKRFAILADNTSMFGNKERIVNARDNSSGF